MIKIFTSFFLILFLVSSLFSKENFSEMSTQELISIIGYVKKSDLGKFKAELDTRAKSMSASEKKTYKENLKKSAKSTLGVQNK